MCFCFFLCAWCFVAEGQPGKEIFSSILVDICDVSANLQAIRATGLQLLSTIQDSKPRVDKHLSEAGAVDVIEYVKGKMVEGEQLGITSKFSAPGKYRRNMKQLKKAVKQLNGVEKETKEIVDLVDSQLEELLNNVQVGKFESSSESLIVPSDKVTDTTPDDDDIFSNLPPIETSSQVESIPQVPVVRYGRFPGHSSCKNLFIIYMYLLTFCSRY